jgi:hypothetical protein
MSSPPNKSEAEIMANARKAMDATDFRLFCFVCSEEIEDCSPPFTDCYMCRAFHCRNCVKSIALRGDYKCEKCETPFWREMRRSLKKFKERIERQEKKECVDRK